MDGSTGHPERAPTGAPWLRPSTSALLALTSEPPDRSAILADPGLVFHVLRTTRPTPDPRSFAFDAEILLQPVLCETAATAVVRPGGTGPDWTDAESVHLGRTAAALARQLAEETRACSPDAAWATALLAPLGWYAAAAIRPHWLATPSDTWALSPTAIARRAVTRWKLPTPFAATVGFLRLREDDAVRVGADAGLFRVVQAGVAVAEERGIRLGLTRPVDSELLDRARELPEIEIAPSPAVDPIPAAILARLLTATAAARRRSASADFHELERQVDGLTAALEAGAERFDAAVREARLAALAEFAAGASHEINNPLAVISGNAQMLLAGEDDPDRQKMLAAVVRCSRRVHDILVGTRQFARPPAPHPTAVSLHELLATQAASHRSQALDVGIAVELGVCEGIAHVDPGHLAIAVGNLVRNSIEATPAGGWVRLSSTHRGDRVALLVEDSGPGPAPSQVPFLFDPFFSGRSAGRGRGLGLSVAWRLAKANGGDAVYEPQPGGPTRFAILLPRAASIRMTA